MNKLLLQILGELNFIGNLTLDFTEYLTFANNLVDEARNIISNEMSSLGTKLKSDGSVVTKIDCEIETYFKNEILKSYPDHGFIGEEFGFHNSSTDLCWIVDPIDGTEELAAGLPLYGTILALRVDNKFKLGIIDHRDLNLRVAYAEGAGFFINNKETNIKNFSAKLPRVGISKRANFSRHGDQNRYFLNITNAFPNCRTYDTCYAYSATLIGSLDCFVEFNVKIWDVAAPIAIAEGIGLSVEIIEEYTMDNIPYYSVAIGKKKIVDQIRSIIANLR